MLNHRSGAKHGIRLALAALSVLIIGCAPSKTAWRPQNGSTVRIEQAEPADPEMPRQQILLEVVLMSSTARLTSGPTAIKQDEWPAQLGAWFGVDIAASAPAGLMTFVGVLSSSSPTHIIATPSALVLEGLPTLIEFAWPNRSVDGESADGGPSDGSVATVPSASIELKLHMHDDAIRVSYDVTWSRRGGSRRKLSSVFIVADGSTVLIPVQADDALILSFTLNVLHDEARLRRIFERRQRERKMLQRSRWRLKAL